MGNIYFRGIRLVFEEKEFNCTFVRKKYWQSYNYLLKLI